MTEEVERPPLSTVVFQQFDADGNLIMERGVTQWVCFQEMLAAGLDVREMVEVVPHEG